MARKLTAVARFKRDYAHVAKNPNFDPETLRYVADLLSQGPLPLYWREHALGKKHRNYAGLTECHLASDLLLIYRELPDEVRFHRIGTHADLFGK